MSKSNRDDFSAKTIEILAKRVTYICSNPECENSIEAIKLAVDKNYAVEIDVRLTLDGKIIVFHDNNLNRMMGKDMIHQ